MYCGPAKKINGYPYYLTNHELKGTKPGVLLKQNYSILIIFFFFKFLCFTFTIGQTILLGQIRGVHEFIRVNSLVPLSDEMNITFIAHHF